MHVSPLTANSQPAVLAYLRVAPYRNALPLSNTTQLRSRCDVLVAEQNGKVVGMASTYHDLPIPNVTFATRSAPVARALLHGLAGRNPHLSEQPTYALLPQARRDQLAHVAQIIEAPVEYQMAIEPEILSAAERWPTQRLSSADIAEMNELARAAGLSVWHSRALALGPAFGCFVDGRLVAMAATHFATADVVEIGHIATHPDYRRRGYATACTAALTRAAFGLAPRVFLMVMADNTAALAAYKKLGFRAIEPFYLTRFLLTRDSEEK
ncbi:MAG TPA: GNAT family N-acetyltransferase [Roseiflexaceae bacterium]